jgi:GWxTD domain-containing protein
MKKIVFILFLAVVSTQVIAQEEVKDMVPFFSYSTFYSPQQGPYIETYLTILGHSLYFQKNENDKYVSNVEMTIIVKKEDVVVDFEKLNLSGPEMDDTSKVNFSLVDVRRFAVPNGDYSIEVKLRDINSPFDALFFENDVALDYSVSVPSVSGIQLVERYKKSEDQSMLTKAGFELTPLPLNFYPKSVNSMTFYAEIYNTAAALGAEEFFLVKAFVEQFENHRIAANMQIFKREKAKEVLSFMHEFDISSLPTGNYFLVVEVRDKNNELVGTNRLFFQRSNPQADVDFLAMQPSFANSFVALYTSRDTLAEFIRSLRPIATENEKVFIDNYTKSADIERLQQFFYAFWISRSDNPQQDWNQYLAEVEKCQNTFATKIKKGYQTDRGRVYLIYGPPNTIVSRDNEPSTYPYEIWHYYSLNNQRNRRFIFYNRDLVTNDYELLHSDAFGEVTDYQWQLKLNQRNFATNDPDLRNADWGWGGRVEDYWNNPR